MVHLSETYLHPAVNIKMLTNFGSPLWPQAPSPLRASSAVLGALLGAAPAVLPPPSPQGGPWDRWSPQAPVAPRCARLLLGGHRNEINDFFAGGVDCRAGGGRGVVGECGEPSSAMSASFSRVPVWWSSCAPSRRTPNKTAHLPLSFEVFL